MKTGRRSDPLVNLKSGRLLLFLEEILDLCKELDLVGGFRRRCGSFFLLLLAETLQCVDALEHCEEDESHDEEVDDGTDECAVVKRKLLNVFESHVGIIDPGKSDGTGNVRAADRIDERRDEVVGEGCDDILESSTDDDTDSHVDYAALKCEFLEFSSEFLNKTHIQILLIKLTESDVLLNGIGDGVNIAAEKERDGDGLVGEESVELA